MDATATRGSPGTPGAGAFPSTSATKAVTESRSGIENQLIENNSNTGNWKTMELNGMIASLFMAVIMIIGPQRDLN